jgi:hypothetical protein
VHVGRQRRKLWKLWARELGQQQHAKARHLISVSALGKGVVDAARVQCGCGAKLSAW